VQQLERAEQGRCARWTRTAIVALSMLAGVGCTEPVFVLLNDGGTDGSVDCFGEDCRAVDRPVPDLDGMVLDPGKLSPPPPSWLVRLQGTYAVRIHYYGTIAKSAQASTEVMGLGEINIGNDSSLQLTICRETTDVRLPSGQRVSRRVVHPRALRKRFFPIEPEQQQWRTMGQRELVGYGAELAQCTTRDRRQGDKVMSDDIEQGWLRGGLCTCMPPSETPPATQEDCRLLDDDKDRLPGITLEWSDSVGTQATTAILDQSQLVHGNSDLEGKHHANFELGEVRSQVTCLPQTSPMCAFGGTITGCSSNANHVDFVKLSDSAPLDCEQLLKSTEGDALFEPRPLKFPDTCELSAVSARADTGD
jgi:hypothetical protein